MAQSNLTDPVGERASSARHGWWVFLCLVAGLMAVLAFLPEKFALTSGQGIVIAVIIAAVVTGIRRNRPGFPLGWWILLASMGYTLLISLVAVALEGLHVIADATQIDVLFHLTQVLLGLGLAVLPVQGRPGLRSAGYVEAGIIASGAAVVWWTLLVDPYAIDAGNVPNKAHVLGYPMFDIILVALGLRLLLLGGTRSPAWLMLAVSMAVQFAADTVFLTNQLSGRGPELISVEGWLLSSALIGAAALHPCMAVAPPADDPADSPDIGTSRIYIGTVVATPIMTGIFLLHERVGLDVSDIVVPVGATALTAALVVTRMRQLNVIARRHATALQESLSKEAELQAELRRRAQHDTLTGLPNRELLYERITTALAGERTGALIILDLDAFKDVNDRFGHAVGDELLLEVARRLRDTVPAGTTLARLDSDEFAVLADSLDAVACTRLGERLLSAMRSPLTVQSHQLFATVSIGLRELDADLLTGDVLRDAYLALHAAKAAGRDQMTVFHRALSEEKLVAARTVERLRGAIERDELVVHYQPLIRLADERMTGVEALLRWQPAGERMVPPDKFIPAAEDSGLIVPIGAWVLRRACEVVAGWHRRQPGVVVSVNVSPRQLREPDFAAQVFAALSDSGLPPSSLILEITEGVLVASGAVTEQAIRHLSTLRARGVKVAVDDFGTGYSSLAYLRDLPIDHVKIDKSFMPVPGTADQAARTMVKAIIDLAAGLELGTIAEGVETAEQVRLLRELGCDRAQGFYFARPLPAEEVAPLLNAASWGTRVG
ncbi:bifunctional diguanylate cyclase/phosphodiesterase [Actinoplanes sp. N902-109]|uniref:putative bifunctional diguanylate cyclase/phosphodiesterase n=1 Tax=Actinoplanes sp. (strain N902-109) TaxID=649831 RepID=UPI0003293F30|nr:bifunctional diguanylate cyclase/phosphodiesterase [Actinoplanes sp. N902-109]AGL18701.1 diguanylate cyclase/phosphodiesterase [Actinoplanes sp. N902-109]